MGIESTSHGYEEKLNEWGVVRAVSNGAAITAQVIDELKWCMPGPNYTLKTWTGMDGTRRDNQVTINSRLMAYWGRPVMVPVVMRTIDAYAGMIWTQEPECELPASLESQEKNLRDTSQMVTNELIGHGRCGVFVDMPTTTGTLAEGKTAYPVFYRPEQIRFWREGANGKLLEVRLGEMYEEKKGEFDWECKEQIRRLIINDSGHYECQIYRGSDMVDSIEPKAGGSKMDEIPFAFGGAEENSSKLSATPMYLMSRLNLAHFRLDADDRDNLHYHGQAMTVVKLGDDENVDTFMENNGGTVDTGASGLNVMSAGGDIDFRQIESTGAIATKMESDMTNMIAAGAQMVKSTNDTTTLGAREMEFSSSTSQLKRIARNQSEMMTEVVRFMCLYMGEAPVDYIMQPKFVTDNVDATVLQQALQYVSVLGFPMDVAIEASRKAGLHDLSNEDMKEKIEDVEPVTPAMTEEQAVAQAAIEADNGNS